MSWLYWPRLGVLSAADTVAELGVAVPSDNLHGACMT